MALQFDDYGFIIGEKRFKELNGNISQIDKTTQEILAVIKGQGEFEQEQAFATKTHFERLIASKKQANKLTKISTEQLEKLSSQLVAKTTGKSSTPAKTTNQPSRQNERTKIIATKNQPNKQEKQHTKPKKQAVSKQHASLPNRDEKGRFIAQDDKQDGKIINAFDKMSRAIWQYVAVDTSSLSPEIDALNEIKDTISPAGRGLVAMGRGAGWLFRRKSKKDELQAPEQDKQNTQINLNNKEKRRLLRLILREVGDNWLSKLAGLASALAALAGLAGGGDDGDDDGVDIDLDRKNNGGIYGGVGGKKPKGKPNRKPKRPTERPRNRLPESRKNPDAKQLPKPKKGVLDRLKNGVKRLPIVGTLATLGLAAYALSDYKNMTASEVGSMAGGAVGGIGGGMAGATAGAAVGSVVPVIGTAAGAIVGGIAGSLGGSMLGEQVGSVLGERLAPFGTQMVNGLSSAWGSVSSTAKIAFLTSSTLAYDALSTGYAYTSNLASNAWQMTQLATHTAKEYALISLERMKNVFVAGLNGFGSIAGTAIDGLGKIFDTAKNFVVENGSTFINWIKEQAGGIGSSLGSVAGSIGETVGGIASSVVDGVTNLFGGGEYKTGDTSKATKYQGGFVDGKPVDVVIFEEFAKLGFSQQQAEALTAEVGRENDFDLKEIFGFHGETARSGISNLGMFSWNQGRDKQLQKLAKERGVLNADGTIQRSRAGIAVQAEFVKQEMQSKRYKGKLSTFWDNPNADAETFAKTLGKHYIVWAYGQDTIQDGKGGRKRFDWQNHDARRRKHLHNLRVNNSKIQGSPSKTNTQTPQTAKPASQQAIAIGDSIAVGVNGKAVSGQAVVGKDTADVLGFVNKMAKAGQLKGRNVVLSTGASNEADNVRYGNVVKQIAALKAAGVNNITMMSVADGWSKNKKKQTYNGKQYGSINEVLENIAAEQGVRFAKWQTDNKKNPNDYHASQAVYQKAIKNANYGQSVSIVSTTPMPKLEPKKNDKDQTPSNVKNAVNQMMQGVGTNTPTILIPKPDGANGGWSINTGGLQLTSHNYQGIQEQSLIQPTYNHTFTAAQQPKEQDSIMLTEFGQNLSDPNLAILVTGGYGHNTLNA